jgi:hypothetical protein
MTTASVEFGDFGTERSAGFFVHDSILDPLVGAGSLSDSLPFDTPPLHAVKPALDEDDDLEDDDELEDEDEEDDDEFEDDDDLDDEDEEDDEEFEDDEDDDEEEDEDDDLEDDDPKPLRVKSRG